MRALVVALLLLAGCTADDVRVQLPEGATVTAAPNGSVSIRVGNRRVLDLVTTSIQAHSYDTTIQQSVGFYEFLRSNESMVAFDRVVARRTDADALEVDLAGEGGALATVRVDDGPVADSSHVRITLTGVSNHDSTKLALRCDAAASFLGFGEQYDALDQRGHAFPLWSQEQGIGRRGNLWLVEGDAHTTYTPMPYFVDARGFGFVVATDARVLVDLCATDPTRATFEVEDSAPIDLYVLHGPTVRDVVRELGDIYGRPHAIPDWALGPWIGIQGGQQAVVDEAAALDANGVPYTALWAQDWVGRRSFTTDQIGVKYHWNVDATLYPDLAGLITSLHAHVPPIRFLGYANPWVVQPLEHYAPMDAAGLLVHDTSGVTYTFIAPSLETSSLPDLWNPDARTYVSGFLTNMVSTLGMDGWMCDFGEALPTDAVMFDGTPGMLAHNRYPVRWHDLHRQVLEAARPNGDFALFARSGWLGVQGTAQILWVGDQEADFGDTDGLPTVIPAMLNLGLSGVPFTTHDIAGFSGGPSTPELYARWTELGAFTLIMRTHEGLKRDLNWNWNGGPSATPQEVADSIAHFRRFARIHEALVPTFAALVDEAATTSMPPLRALVLEYPNDRETLGVTDEFLIGTDLLVAPVVHEGVTERDVYIPAGTWFHVFTGTPYEGPAHVTVAAPIGTPPVFSRGADRTDLRAIQ